MGGNFRNPGSSVVSRNSGDSILVVVESPTKSRKISSILGKGYKVVATFGHIRDLPERTMGFSLDDILQGEPKITWVEIKRKVINSLREEFRKSSDVIIATDPDREGEAIGWHVASILGVKNPKRAVFHEITPNAVRQAIASPRQIDMNLVSAQITRRVIDRIVGYTLSPLFWRLRKNSSAGRVQSAALHLIVKRWKEVQSFERKPYFLVYIDFGEFIAYLYERYRDFDGKEKVRLKRFQSEQEAREIVEKITEVFVSRHEKGTETKSPPPPYTTSYMLQDAKNILGFSSDFAMKVAQSLFENGFITYHRTDSVSISDEGFAIAGRFFSDNAELSDISSVPRRWKTKVANAQEAHEAIRPTEEGMRKFYEIWNRGVNIFELKKENLSPYEKLLFLIGTRFLMSQSKNAVYDYIIIEFSSEQIPKELFFRAKLKRERFDGFLRIMRRGEIGWKGQDDRGKKIKDGKNTYLSGQESDEEEIESSGAYNFALGLERGERLKVGRNSSPCVKFRKEYTQPPPLYTEATLIKEMEKLGIGRPSTYSTIISILKRRGYIIEEKGKLIPSPEGVLQDEILEKNFPEICSPEFTAKMEDQLDSIARGEVFWKEALRGMAKRYLDEFQKFKHKFEEVVKSISEISHKISPSAHTRGDKSDEFAEIGEYEVSGEDESVRNAIGRETHSGRKTTEFQMVSQKRKIGGKKIGSKLSRVGRKFYFRKR